MEGLARTLAQHGSGIAQAISCCYHIMSVFISYEYGFLFFFGPSRSQLVPAGLMTELDSEAGLETVLAAIECNPALERGTTAFPRGTPHSSEISRPIHCGIQI